MIRPRITIFRKLRKIFGKGFSLIELMVYVFISLLLLQLMIFSTIIYSRTFRLSGELFTFLTDVKVALNLIEYDINMAGFNKYRGITIEEIYTSYNGSYQEVNLRKLWFKNDDRLDDITIAYLDIEDIGVMIRDVSPGLSPEDPLTVNDPISFEDFKEMFPDPDGDKDLAYPVLIAKNFSDKWIGCVIYVTDLKDSSGIKIYHSKLDFYSVNDSILSLLSPDPDDHLILIKLKGAHLIHYYVSNGSLIREDWLPSTTGRAFVDPLLEGVEDFRLRFSVDANNDGIVDTDASGNIVWYDSLSDNPSDPNYLGNVFGVEVNIVFKTKARYNIGISDNPLTPDVENDLYKRIYLRRSFILRNFRERDV